MWDYRGAEEGCERVWVEMTEVSTFCRVLLLL